MGAAMDVGTRQELEGERKAIVAMQPEREAASMALANRPGYDVSTLSDKEFDQGLERIKVRQKRMQRILDAALVEGVHYGNPKNGERAAFKKPMLYQAGAEELRSLFRLTPRHMEPPIIIATEAFVSVTVTMGLYTSGGMLAAVRSGNCNTMEKRFERNDRKGFTYKDAREQVHSCLAMAEKRALAFGTKEATGATAFFAAEEEMEAALDEGKAEPVPWTDAEKKEVFGLAKEKGMTRPDMERLMEQTLGGRFVETGDPAAKLRTAVERWQRPGVPPVRTDGYDDGSRSAAISDAELDRELAAEEG